MLVGPLPLYRTVLVAAEKVPRTESGVDEPARFHCDPESAKVWAVFMVNLLRTVVVAAVVGLVVPERAPLPSVRLKNDHGFVPPSEPPRSSVVVPLESASVPVPVSIPYTRSMSPVPVTVPDAIVVEPSTTRFVARSHCPGPANCRSTRP